MSSPSNSRGSVDAVRIHVDAVYRADSRRVFATFIRLLGDFDVAEEALHDAFRAALEQWPRDGIPASPRAWLVSVGRFKAIDGIRRRARFEALRVARDERITTDDDAFDHGGSTSAEDSAAESTESTERLRASVYDAGALDDEVNDEGCVADDRLRLIFVCCHPALSADAQVALTLREVCGLTTEEIAHAFLTAAPTLAQRIVRAKAKIREARIPYEVPGRAQLPDRLDSVLRVIYLVFNEGYLASSGRSLTRRDLSGEAIRLGRLLIQMLPEPEALGLLALMLLHESRRAARTSPAGELVLLDEQNRSLWDRDLIAEGSSLVERALLSRRFGAYTLQAAIAAVHAQASDMAATDWTEIVGLYDVLQQTNPSPVVELNRAVALAMRDGPAAGLAVIDAILARGDLADYRLAHAARADLCRRLSMTADARRSYQRAFELTRQEPERRFIERRLRELQQD